MLWMPKQGTAFLLCAALSLITIFAPPTNAQTPSAATPPASPKTDQLLEFEVATIKPVDQRALTPMGTDIDPGGMVKLNGSLKNMIEVAFNVSSWQIEGGEAWMGKNLYNVVGEPPDTVRQTRPDTRHTWYSIEDPRLREMLQALLIERFQLKVHRTTQIGKVYFLERTGKPLALLPTKAVSADPSSPQSRFGSVGWAERWVLYDTTMPELANFASSYVLHRPVLDHTGLTGAFDYWSAPEVSNTPQVDQESSFMSLLHEVGLTLEPAQGQAKMPVIDHAELPSPN
jgi:uncharacterized protein (TIGR03435 family)